MTFISSTFAIFFAIFSVLYFIAAELKKGGLKFQRLLLLTASIIFYAFADLRFLPFMFYAVALSYFGGLSFCIGGGIGEFAFSRLLPPASRLFYFSSIALQNGEAA